MDNFDKQIGKALRDDQLPFGPGDRIHDRLSYHMQLKASGARVRKNQFFTLPGTLLTTKLLAWKIGFAAVLVISFMGYRHLEPTTTGIQLVDTTQRIQPVDTTHIMPKDTAMIY